MFFKSAKIKLFSSISTSILTDNFLIDPNRFLCSHPQNKLMESEFTAKWVAECKNMSQHL